MMATTTTAAVSDDAGRPPSSHPQKSNVDPDPKPRHGSSAAAMNRPSSHRSRALSPIPRSIPRRRSSVLSLSSLDDAAQSFADDIINPRTHKSTIRKDGEDEVTHWHSTPLAFAILPAVAGLLFKNGSTFVTDVLLLALAAVFLNWSVRLPWDWYYASQATTEIVVPDFEEDTILEEEAEEESAVETGSSNGGSPIHASPTQTDNANGSETRDLSKREQAAADLRRQELLALVATFIFPILAAYLLHVIRAQLSRPSTGLVSDYNLTIFILAAEIRPCRQLCRLIANRTLYLKRAATGDSEPTLEPKSKVSALMQRVDELESRLSDGNSGLPSLTIAQKADISELQSEMKKRYEPRFEGLERAVRRYEKRSTTFTMAIDQRLLALEGRTNDAFSLAAVAAQNSRGHGIFDIFVDLVTSAVVLPIKLAWSACKFPVNMAEEAYTRFKVLMLGPAYAPRTHGAKRSSDYGSATSGRYSDRDEKARLKYSGKKTSRESFR
nr:hypothetical protein CFP56_75543 [Quercus suber]